MVADLAAGVLELPIHDQLGAVVEKRAADGAGTEDLVQRLALDAGLGAEHQRLEDGRKRRADHGLKAAFDRLALTDLFADVETGLGYGLENIAVLAASAPRHSRRPPSW